MPTTAQNLYPSVTDWDGADPASGDFRKVIETIPAGDTTTECDFGSSGGAVSIVCDPFTTRTTTGITDLDKFGWTVNLAGADGMGSTATARRRVPSGNWTFGGRIASTVAAVNPVTVNVRVSRVDAGGGRTSLMTGSQSVSGVTAAGASFGFDIAGQPEILFEADETFAVHYYLTATPQVGGLLVRFGVGDGGVLNDCGITLPSPGIRTRYTQSVITTTGQAVPSGAVALPFNRIPAGLKKVLYFGES